MVETNSSTVPQDPMAAVALPHRYTNAGIKRRNAKLRKEGRLAKGPTVKIVRDELDGQMQARKDAADGKIEPWSSPDPLQEAVDRAPHNPNMRRHLLSERVIKRRGMRGWLPVKDAKGDLVKVGDQFLGEMPIAKANQRNRFYQETGNSQVREQEGSHREAVEKLKRDASSLGLSINPLNEGDIVSGSEVTRMTGSPQKSTSIGYEVRRGN